VTGGANGSSRDFPTKGTVMRGSGLIWTIVGVLLIVALVIFIF